MTCALSRVAHVISTPKGIGGAEQTLADLIAHCPDSGRDFLVLNPFALNPDDPQIRALYSPARYEGHPAASWRRLPALRRWLSGQLERFEPDIVHVHLFHASALVASLRRPLGAQMLLSHQHGDHFQAIGARSYELVDRLAGRRFDHIVGCSQSVEDYLLYRYRYPPTRVSHVFNGWSGNPVLPSPDPNRHDIVCVARLRAQKNHHLLIDALVGVREQFPDVRLLLVGDGPERGVLEARVRDRGLTSSVEFLGSVQDVWPILARAQVFVLPSHYEPLGIAALEAMAAGLPVVASAVGGLREIVESGRTGFLVAPGDVREFSQRIVELLVDRERAASMGLSGQAVAERFRVQEMAEGYERVYARLLSR